MALYGKQVIISLIDQKGGESKVGDEYETQFRLFNHPDIKYIAYDFHDQCKNNNYLPLERLVKSVSDDIQQFGFFFSFFFIYLFFFYIKINK